MSQGKRSKPEDAESGPTGKRRKTASDKGDTEEKKREPELMSSKDLKQLLPSVPEDLATALQGMAAKGQLNRFSDADASLVKRFFAGEPLIKWGEGERKQFVVLHEGADRGVWILELILGRKPLTWRRFCPKGASVEQVLADLTTQDRIEHEKRLVQLEYERQRDRQAQRRHDKYCNAIKHYIDKCAEPKLRELMQYTGITDDKTTAAKARTALKAHVKKHAGNDGPLLREFASHLQILDMAGQPRSRVWIDLVCEGRIRL